MSKSFYDGVSTPLIPGKPIVFTFHGTGGDEHQLHTVAQRALPGAGVISLRGDVTMRGGRSFYSDAGSPPTDFGDLDSCAARVAEYMTAWTSTFQNSPVFGIGYSNGADILAAVARAYPGLLQRIVLLHVHAPYEHQTPPSLNDLKVLITTGKRDQISTPSVATGLAKWFETAGADVTTHIHDGGHELRFSELDAAHALFHM